jgi:SAM-dependent methyltransferase
MKDQPGFFDFAAEVGLTKHIGGISATQSLVELCHISQDSYVLDVGCGVGVTPCFLAKEIGCRVMGVDISEKMVERSLERARKTGLSEKVEIRVADAQDLPFGSDLFDTVITESVTAFPEDKQKAVNEYARVIKPGGYVGLNESVWMQVPPPPEVEAWAKQEVGATVKPLPPAEWVALLNNAGLQVIYTQSFVIDLQEEEKGLLQRYGSAGMVGVMLRMLWLYVRNPDYRAFVKRVRQGGITPPNLQEYFGYGLFVGRKE